MFSLRPFRHVRFFRQVFHPDEDQRRDQDPDEVSFERFVD